MAFIEFLKKNYDWILSGLGTSIIFFILGSKYGYKKSTKQSQKLGNNSSAIQVGGDYIVQKAESENR